MTGRLTRERMLDALEAQVGLVRFALAGDGAGTAADLAAPVPSCPDWTVHALVAHLGTANWWGGANVRDANPDARARGMREVMESAPPATEGAAALAEWYAGLAVDAVETYADTDPDRIAEELVAALAQTVDYLPVPSDGATRAARLALEAL